jgi:hypothetical protein
MSSRDAVAEIRSGRDVDEQIERGREKGQVRE